MKINSESLADMMFTLEWRSTNASHTDCYFGESVNLWRDCLPDEVYRSIAGLTAGDRVTLDFQPGEVLPHHSDDRILTLKKRQFGTVHRAENGVVPAPGRFYPKGLLNDLAGIFPNNVEPFRCCHVDDTQLTVDFNHPMSGIPFSLAVEIESVAEKEKERGGSCTDWIETATAGPGMQSRLDGRQTDFFAADAFSRQDESADNLFYQSPRMVNHIDDRARAVVQDFYRGHLKPNMRVLDLMAGWESHIGNPSSLESVTGLGMNQDEMAANPALSEHVVHDLNRVPELPFGDGAFDAVVCTVSIEYLTRPAAVFAEVARVLVPGGLFVITFSNRWFPPKVTHLWTTLHEFERMGFVSELFFNTPGFGNIATYSMRGLPRPESDRYYPGVRLSDPIYAVSGKKLAPGS